MSKTEIFLVAFAAALIAVPLVDYVAAKLGVTALQG